MAELGRVVLSLAVVLGLMWGLARFVKRPTARSRNGKLLDIVSREQLTRNSSIAVVRVLDQALIVGVTDGQVSLIGEVDLEAVEVQLAAAATQSKTKRSRAVPVDPNPVAPVYIPADIPGADLLNKAARSTAKPAAAKPVAGPAAASATHQGAKQGSVGAPKTTQDAKSSALSGSALSPATWRQTVESLRDLTVRTR
ncbi:flagellar biosynthetic protein FliO [Jatrophihabitans sp. GAS493]|uniref:FliO/MopB family protein n=1 Tax=Jatrophihabitans sp. GAS493 TaxID=1907575 RepID=UPI0015614CB2|nr:flagellar biosynthetic protein FliO [Jatrophihabitans sp. GAS493]